MSLAGPPPSPMTGQPGPTQPWLIVMADGKHCTAITGTSGYINGQRRNYGCTGGGSLYGYPVGSGAVQTIDYQAPNSSSAVQTDIAIIYD